MLSTKKLIYHIADTLGTVETNLSTVTAKYPALVVTQSAVSSLPVTISDTDIESDMVVVNSELSAPSAQTSDWTVTTSAGSLTISGSVSGSTDVTLYLTKSR